MQSALALMQPSKAHPRFTVHLSGATCAGNAARQQPIEYSIEDLCKLISEVNGHHPRTYVPYLVHTMSLYLEAALHPGAGVHEVIVNVSESTPTHLGEQD